MSKHSQEESRHQEQILKLQADMATRIAKSEERILSLEEQLKVLSTSQKEGNATLARMEQLLSQQNQPKSPRAVSPQGSGILKTPPLFNECSKSINRSLRNHELDNK
jgi:hypothetical protein